MLPPMGKERESTQVSRWALGEREEANWMSAVAVCDISRDRYGDGGQEARLCLHCSDAHLY